MREERKQWLLVGKAVGLLVAVFCGIGLLGSVASGLYAKAKEKDVPSDPLEVFKKELAVPENVESVYVSEDGLVCGFSMRGDATEIFEELSQMMADRGWVEIESGAEHTGTYLRDDRLGEEGWASISCSGMNGEVCVVEEYA